MNIKCIYSTSDLVGKKFLEMLRHRVTIANVMYLFWSQSAHRNNCFLSDARKPDQLGNGRPNYGPYIGWSVNGETQIVSLYRDMQSWYSFQSWEKKNKSQIVIEPWEPKTVKFRSFSPELQLFCNVIMKMKRKM